MASYDVGSLVKLAAVFTVSGTATDPTSVTCTVSDPSGTLTTPTPVHDSTGNYHALVDLTAATPGAWRYRWSGTGACQAAEESSFFVEPSLLNG